MRSSPPPSSASLCLRFSSSSTSCTPMQAPRGGGVEARSNHAAPPEGNFGATRRRGPPAHPEFPIQPAPECANGVYSNLMMVSHRKEEFILDFLFLQPQRSPQGQSVATLRSRVVTSPEHTKRIVRALQENIRRYEETFEPIQEATDIPKMVP